MISYDRSEHARFALATSDKEFRLHVQICITPMVHHTIELLDYWFRFRTSDFYDIKP
jgi:hypothetical protein